MAELWHNRAGNQRALVQVVRPTTEHELCGLVADAAARGDHLKVVGSGYSCSGAALTDGVLVSLEDYARVLAFDPVEGLLTVQAGARLHDLAQYLRTRGFAFDNLGDVDAQSIAGATSTATHGTGLGHRSLSSSIVGMRVIDGNGELHDASTAGDADLLRVGRVGVGALGVLSTLTVEVVPAFNLHVVEQPVHIDELVDSFTDRVSSNDHFDFAYLPHTQWALARAGNRHQEPPGRRGRVERWRHATSTRDRLVGLADRIGRARPGLVAVLADALRHTVAAEGIEYDEGPDATRAARPRARFLEMEYTVPLEATVQAVGEVRRWVDATGAPTVVPVRVGTVAADDIALSGAHGRPSGYIVVRVPRRYPYEGYFRAVEDIMRGHDGRPHWGKLHFRSAEDLAPSYPEWDSFQRVRARMDPAGVFENQYTRRCFGRAG